MELSKRLQAVADFVTAGYITADIGTDHAYIPIYLIENKISPHAFAMDINEGPLMRAKEHVVECGYSKQIVLRQSDGMKALKEKEAQTVVIAGMGGGLVMKILTDSWKVTCSLKECILQPQSEIAKVRAFLLKKGFLFMEENMVLEDGKFYPMMKVKPPSLNYNNCEQWTETQIRYGKLLLEQKNPVLKKFLEKEISVKEEIIKKLKKQTGEHADQRIKELCEDLEFTRKGMEYYAL